MDFITPLLVIYFIKRYHHHHTAQWIDGEKLSQSKANDVGALVNLGVITYLTQLLDTGFFHADPHPGNMLRTPEGKLVILDFGLMTQITDDQKYGMIEAIAHLIHRDYSEIGNDFVNLDFIPKGVDTAPIVPALARVFEAALAGGGAKSINFQELAGDLAEITFKFPFRIPPYFALVIRAISVLEGIALVGNPEFAIIDEAYPYISKRLMTDESPRLKAAFRYMVYGQSDVLDVDRIIDMLQALEKFVAVKDTGDGSAFKKDGMVNGRYVGQGGDAVGTKKVDLGKVVFASIPSPEAAPAPAKMPNDVTKEALKFLFSDDGYLLREFILEETCNTVDAISRDAARYVYIHLYVYICLCKFINYYVCKHMQIHISIYIFKKIHTCTALHKYQHISIYKYTYRELFVRVGIRGAQVPGIFRALAPKLTEKDKKAVESISKLLTFLIGTLFSYLPVNPFWLAPCACIRMLRVNLVTHSLPI